MKSVDQEVTDRSIKFMGEAQDEGKPFFVWWNASRMQMFTHLSEEARGKSGQGFYNDGMVEHDGHVGQLLDYLEKEGIMDNTIIIYGTDNGPHYNMWPDGAISPFRSEKETNWEGAYRVPTLIQWTNGGITGGKMLNGMISHLDWLPTLVAAAGDTSIKEKLLKGGYEANNKDFKVHLDGYNLLPYLQGKEKRSRRDEFIYFNADAQIVCVRFDEHDYLRGASSMNSSGGVLGDKPKEIHSDVGTAWKVVYAEQRAHTMALWTEPFVWLRLPKLFNLRRDPFERADTDSDGYWVWHMNHVFVFYKGNEIILEHMKTYKDYPPSQMPGSFTMNNAKEVIYSSSVVGPGSSSGKGIDK